MKYLTLPAFIFLMGFLAGCGLDRFAIEPVPLAPAIPVVADARPAPIGFNKIRFAIPTGTPVVAKTVTDPTGFGGCESPYGIVQSGLSSRSFPNEDFRAVFLDSLKALGYDVAGDPGRLFDEDEDLMRSQYAVGASVVDVKINACDQMNVFGFAAGATGEAVITVDWTVFDLLNRKNALKTTTKGYAKVRLPNHEATILLLEQAFAAATHNLGARADFHDLVFLGTVPAGAPDTVDDPYENPVRIFNPQEKVDATNPLLSKQPAAERMDEIVKTVVMIQAGQGHGSGFFISDQGHIVTNAHVVGNAQRVRVVMAGKKNKGIAEVLRVNHKRDVALLKLEAIPDNFVISVLPIQPEKPVVGAEVYAIGAPAKSRLQDTVTKGIVSAHRYIPDEKQWLIQSDVFIYGGNSGGPLIDAQGNIVGLTVSGWERGGVSLSGLNNFVPIADALEKLDIFYK
jgi:serine protease Do